MKSCSFYSRGGRFQPYDRNNRGSSGGRGSSGWGESTNSSSDTGGGWGNSDWGTSSSSAAKTEDNWGTTSTSNTTSAAPTTSTDDDGWN